jgi:phosphatidylglycerol---prolipoprotein diacylglyceryl transferase
MLPSISLGRLVIPTGPFLVILGIWLALWLVEKGAALRRQDGPTVYALAVASLAVGAAVARLSFVALYWPAYRAAPLSIIWPMTSGFLPWAGLLAGGAAAFFYGRYRRLPLRETVDALTAGLLSLFLIASLVDFAAGPGYGEQTALPWAITSFGVSRHPVQLYEIVFVLAALAVWFRLVERPAFAGQPFLSAVIIYSGGRLFVEAFRANSLLVGDGYRAAQLLALAVLLVALFLWGQWRMEAQPTTVEDETPPTDNGRRRSNSPARQNHAAS